MSNYYEGAMAQVKKEQEILDFYNREIENPDLKEELDNLTLSEKARLLAFVQLRDKELYSKLEKLIF